MPQPVRTLIFAVLALASLGLAWGMHVRNRPQPLSEFNDVGQEFFPAFVDPNTATGLQVAAYDAESGKTNVFKVEQRDGVWRIPSHHDYPADGKERLAKTAASMLGVVRLALVERTKAAHKRYRVLDPMDDSIDGTEGRGERITLYQGDEVVVDLIVGNKTESGNGVYYVRDPKRDQIYTADLGNLQVSTKFADWIQADLLELDRNELSQIVVDTYHVDEEREEIVPEEQFVLAKGDGPDWTLEGLDPAVEKLKSSEVSATVSALDDLRIVGVRRKPEALSLALKGEGGGISRDVKLDMQEKGFFFSPATRQIVANEGNIIVGTNKGIVYIVKFGEEFSGDEVALEIGASVSAEPANASEPTGEEAASPAGEESATEPATSKPSGRYIFVGANFSPDLLGPKPIPPVKPEPPTATPATEPAAPPAEATPDAATQADEPAAADAADPVATPDAATPPATDPAAPAATDPAATPPATAPVEDPQVAYEKALKEYEFAMGVYEQQVKFYDEDVKLAQERVAKLNRRFADWYYVIGDDVYKRLRLTRAAIVEPPTPATPDATGLEGLMLPGLDGPVPPEATESVPPSVDPGNDRPVPPAQPEATETTTEGAGPPAEDAAKPAAEPAATESPATEPETTEAPAEVKAE